MFALYGLHWKQERITGIAQFSCGVVCMPKPPVTQVCNDVILLLPIYHMSASLDMKLAGHLDTSGLADPVNFGTEVYWQPFTIEVKGK